MAKTIKIFLVDGEPDGLKVVELSNWVGQAIVVPRNKLRDIKQRADCSKPAVYFLVGKESEDALLPTAYIGEAENLWNRLVTHDNSKDFWIVAVAFVSKDSNLTKAHVKYLESRCVGVATKVGRCDLKNGAQPALPALSESDVAEMEEFLDNLRLLLTAVGYPFLQEVAPKDQIGTSDPLFFCEGKMAMASGRMTNDGFVVYKDSTATMQFSSSVSERNKRNVEKLISGGYLGENGKGLYFFIKDYVFNTPSAASDIILGNSTSGWKKWKTKNGKTLEDIYRK